MSWISSDNHGVPCYVLSFQNKIAFKVTLKQTDIFPICPKQYVSENFENKFGGVGMSFVFQPAPNQARYLKWSLNQNLYVFSGLFYDQPVAHSQTSPKLISSIWHVTKHTVQAFSYLDDWACVCSNSFSSLFLSTDCSCWSAGAGCELQRLAGSGVSDGVHHSGRQLGFID